MTETASGSARHSGKGVRKGLTMRRIHTRAGSHPYDEVTWERRDVVMTNWRDGSVNFEQRGVEFPDFWSVNAANIVTTKYFRGAVGTPQREYSLKQLVDRVVGVYVAAGKEHGYFASSKDAEIFDHELTYALIHQVFSFNSPVWFNVGTSSPQQVSACQPYDAPVSTPAGLVPIGRLVEEDAVGTKVLRRAWRDPDRRDQGQRRQGSAPAAHQGRRHPGCHAGSSRLAGAGLRHRRVHRGRFAPARRFPPARRSRCRRVGPSAGRDQQGRTARRNGGLRHPDRERRVPGRQPSRAQLLHPGRRRHDGLDPRVVQGRGPDLQGRIGFRGQPVRIRSSKELLSSGGTASGPVSFMRGADASAGTIKSGGATRRAAKMVVLDVDHPDVGEFIETKAREEEKVRVLRDARVRHGSRRQGHHQRPVPECQQLGPGLRRVHGRGRGRRSVRPARPADR